MLILEIMFIQNTMNLDVSKMDRMVDGAISNSVLCDPFLSSHFITMSLQNIWNLYVSRMDYAFLDCSARDIDLNHVMHDNVTLSYCLSSRLGKKHDCLDLSQFSLKI